MLKPTPYGARIVNGKMVIMSEHIDSDRNIPHDQRMFAIVQQIANDIWPHKQFTVEIPSSYSNGLIPVLDMQVGVNQLGQIVRQFYSKPVNTPFTILARSAHPWQLKCATLTHEGVQRLLNMSVNNPSQVTNNIMNQWDNKMNISGYNKGF